MITKLSTTFIPFLVIILFIDDYRNLQVIVAVHVELFVIFNSVEVAEVSIIVVDI